MNIQKDLEQYVIKIKSHKNRDLCDLCLCLVDLNRVKKAVENLDEERIIRAIEYSHKIKRNDITAMLRLLQHLTILKMS